MGRRKLRYLAIGLIGILMVCVVAMLALPARAEGAAAPEAVAFDWGEALSYLLYGVLSVMAAVITKFVVPYLKTLTAAKTAKIADDKLRDGVNDAIDAVLTAVTVTNQTYVETLKNKDMFDEAAQREAFRRSKATAQYLLTEGAREALQTMYGSVSTWLDARIEQTINEQKNTVTIAEAVTAVVE